MTSIGYKKIDFYIKELKIAIEFNGNLFHANPKYFKKNDNPNFHCPELTAEQIWEKDQQRYKTLEEEHGIKTIILWESDYTDLFNFEKYLRNHGILF